MRVFVLCWMFVAISPVAFSGEPLTSWNDGASKRALVEFVEAVTDESSDRYVKPDDRIAVFDNDGTLWCEKPVYVQLSFALDRIKALAAEHPEWRDEQPFKAVLENDISALKESGKEGLVKIIATTHAGMTDVEFNKIAREWLQTAKHPTLKKPYTKCVYQPMLEVLDYLRTNGFKTYIVSGGGIELIRVFAEDVYGIPPEQVIGSSIKTVYEERKGVPSIIRLPEIDFIDDKAGKPVGIQKFIGRRPIMAFGNSDGDFEMLRYTTAGDAKGFGMIVHHTDAKREFAYDRQSAVGKLVKGLDQAESNSWHLADMKNDWKVIFPE